MQEGISQADFAELVKKFDVHIASSTERDSQISELYKFIIVGNGTPSLKHRVARLEENTLTREEYLSLKIHLEHEKKRDAYEWYLMITVTGLILGEMFGFIASKMSLF